MKIWEHRSFTKACEERPYYSYNPLTYATILTMDLSAKSADVIY